MSIAKYKAYISSTVKIIGERSLFFKIPYRPFLPVSENMGIPISSKAVSYTHLDVYKRQA